MSVCEADSQPQHQVSDRLAPANPLELTVELLGEAFRITLIVVLLFLVLNNFNYIRNCWPVKHLYKQKRHAHCACRRAKTRASHAPPPIAPP